VSSLILRDRQASLVDSARRKLACASSVADVKKILDTAEAAELYARRQRLSDDVIGRSRPADRGAGQA
jgi:hypothetical protein